MMTSKFFLYTYKFQLNYHCSIPPKPLKISSFSTPWGIYLMGLSSVEKTLERQGQKNLKNKFPSLQDTDLHQYSLPWRNISFESTDIPQEWRQWGQSKIMTQFKTDSLAVCGITSRAQHNSKKPPKAIVTQGQRSVARVLKIAHNGNKIIKVWKCDSRLQNAFLLCVRITGNNISSFVIGRDQRSGSRHVHTLTGVPWKHTAPDESLHKKRNQEGTLDTDWGRLKALHNGVSW